MVSGFDFESVRFAESQWLWLLLVPVLLLVVWTRQFLARRRDVHRLAHAQQVPVRQRFPWFGDSLFWLCLMVATSLLIAALARPSVVVSLVRKGGVDMVILLDGSASMQVRDVPGNRWQRAVRFLRVLGDSLRWEEDRVALMLFASIAAPQVRLTKDPNTYFFFLDHLAEQSPFPIEEDTSWDTNIELGLSWGMRVIDKDAKVNGVSRNAPMFVLLTDGQAWSGTVEKSLALAKTRNIPVQVVGVGTIGGGIIPEPPRPVTAASDFAPVSPVFSSLDRASLSRIATSSGGQYLELDRDSDVDLANRIISAARRRVTSLPPEPGVEELYWRLLFAAGCVGLAGVIFLRDPAELWVQAAGGVLVLASVATLLV